MKKEITLSDRGQLNDIMLDLREAVETGRHIITIKKEVRTRTTQQNKSVFLYYRIICTKLNDAGFTMRSFFSALKSGFELAVQPENVRTVAEQVSMDMYNKPVKQLSTVEIQELHLTIDKGFSVSMGVSSPWPSDEPPVYEGTNE